MEEEFAKPDFSFSAKNWRIGIMGKLSGEDVDALKKLKRALGCEVKYEVKIHKMDKD